MGVIYVKEKEQEVQQRTEAYRRASMAKAVVVTSKNSKYCSSIHNISNWILTF